VIGNCPGRPASRRLRAGKIKYGVSAKPCRQNAGGSDRVIMGYLFALGFVSILGQVVLLRELSVAFYGIELIYTLALGIWLLATGVGAMIPVGHGTHTSLTNLLFLLFSIVLPLDVALARSVRLVFTTVPGLYLPLESQIAAICMVLLPIGIILGFLFPWAARTFIAGGKSLAGAYAVESIGGLAGGLCATLLLKFGFQNLVIALFCALAAAVASFLDFDGRSFGKIRAASIAVTCALMIVVWKAPVLDTRMTAWTHPNLVDAIDSPYSRITVTYLDGQVSVFENDALLFDTEETRAEEFVQLAALQHPNPARVLILGGGIEGTIRQILLHSPQIVDYVELNASLLQIVPPNLPVEVQKSLRAENVRIIQDDPRRFLERCLTYDVILVGMPEPGSGQANRFYTQEFFRQCRSRLNRDGILAFSLQSSENIWPPQLTRRMISIYRAAKSVFPEVLFLPGSRNVVVGSMHSLPRDPSILAARLETRGIQTKMISPGYLRYLYTNDRFAEVARTLESGTAPMNTDVHPICYQYTVTIWLSKFLPSAKFWDFSLPGSRNGQALAFLLALGIPALLLSRAAWPVRRALLTGVAGFAGMVMETLIILYFQTKSGVLYQDIGILLTGFMAGLAFGAFAMEKMRARPPKVYGFILLGGFCFLCGTAGWWMHSGKGAGLPESLGSLFLTGTLVAGIFAYAGLHEPRDPIRAVTPLYSADLIGGCVGSILATLVLTPLAGLAVASHLMIPVLMLSALLL
jgi:spermidine synthase